MNLKTYGCLLLMALVSKFNAEKLAFGDDSFNSINVDEGSTTGFKNSYSDLANSKVSENVNKCPAGWIFEGNACFYFNMENSKMNLTYISAQGECDTMGGYLAEPITDLEQEFLYSMATIIEVSGQRSNWWIGLSDVSHEGYWYWQHNETALVFSSWVEGRPNLDSPNLDDCTILYSDDHSYDWLDVNCEKPASNVPVSFVCQKINDGLTTTTEATSTATHDTSTIASTTKSPTCVDDSDCWYRYPYCHDGLCRVCWDDWKGSEGCDSSMEYCNMIEDRCVPFSGYSYVSDTYCWAGMESTESLSSAVSTCNANIGCYGFFDNWGRGETYYLCLSSSTKPSNSGSNLWLKE